MICPHTITNEVKKWLPALWARNATRLRCLCALSHNPVTCGASTSPSGFTNWLIIKTSCKEGDTMVSETCVAIFTNREGRLHTTYWRRKYLLCPRWWFACIYVITRTRSPTTTSSVIMLRRVYPNNELELPLLMRLQIPGACTDVHKYFMRD